MSIDTSTIDNPTVVFTGPRQVTVEARDARAPEAGEVLVRTEYSGISAGTEMNVYRGIAPQWTARLDPDTGIFLPTETPEWTYPLAYGYAGVGHVVAVGSGVSGFFERDLVFSYTAHQAYATVPAGHVVPLPTLRDDRHGVFFANLNTALNGVLDARVALGETVVVTGLGVIGLLVVQLARRAGAGQIVAVDGIAHRRALAGRLGADVTMEPGPDVTVRVREMTDNRGADKVIEVSGAPPALNEAIRTAGAGGLVVAMSWYGGTFESLTLGGEFHHNRVRIHSSQVAAVNPDLGPLWDVPRRSALALRLLNELLLDPLITHEYPVQRAAEAYRTVDAGDAELVQAIITYHSGE